MKPKFRILSVIFALCLALSALTPAFAADYKVGDIVIFGEYPQSQVTDEATLAKLNALEPEMTAVGDYCSVADVTEGGVKYRAVKYSGYRPTNVMNAASADPSGEAMFTNGYRTGVTYWFAFEPLEWRVLDGEKGLILCEKVIDCMAVNDRIYEKDGSYYADEGCTVYANDYATCSLRAFLNGEFTDTAFSEEEQAFLVETELDNSACTKKDSAYDSAKTKDKIFLLSYDETIREDYAFSKSPRADYTRYAWPTDFARARGIYVTVVPRKACNGCAPWRLRSPGNESGTAGCVSRDGLSFDYNEVTSTDRGVRPAAVVRLDKVKNGERNAICTHLCHQDGVAGFFWKILNFFNRMLGINQYCSCGKAHY